MMQLLVKASERVEGVWVSEWGREGVFRPAEVITHGSGAGDWWTPPLAAIFSRVIGVTGRWWWWWF